MPEGLEEQKAAMRRRLREVLAAISPEERDKKSAQACELLQRQTVWKQARSVLFYAPLPRELDVWPLIGTALREGKQVALPQFLPERKAYTVCAVRDLNLELRSGRFGIREPVESCPMIELNRLDLALVPGVAFDLHGRRLGRGKGYYDQLLGSVRGKLCAVAFDEQIVREVPVEPHDVHLNCILTPTRWIEL
jgi:5-formyltetrahydrofolate cyclo-ligase